MATRLKVAPPYTFRFQTHPPRSRGAHPDRLETTVTMLKGVMTTRRVIEELVRQLPTGWQATLSAVLILYEENIDDYPQVAILARSGDVAQQ